MLRVALIGCGNIGVRAHLPTCTQVPETELVAVCDIIEKRVQAAAERSGATAYTDHRRLLKREDVDVVIIALPNDLRIGQTRHFDHRYVNIKEQLDAGKVGRPIFIRHSARQFLPFPPHAWQWDPQRGGGVFLNISIHATDLFHWFFGENAIEVFAMAKSVRETARAGGCYDHAFITCKFEGGGIGFAEPSWVYPGDFGGTLYAQLDVVGTEGKIQYADKDTNPMLTYTTEKDHELPRYFEFMSTTEYAFEEEIRHFARCVLDDQQPAVSPEDARAALEMTLAAQRSAETGRPVQLPLG